MTKNEEIIAKYTEATIRAVHNAYDEESALDMVRTNFRSALTTKDQEIAQQLLDIEAERWKDAQHCTCLGYAIVTIFGDEYEEKIKKCREDSKCKHGEIKKVVDTIITTHNTGKDEEMKYSRSPLTGELRPTFINRDELLKALK